jgi:hypothetical protein
MRALFRAGALSLLVMTASSGRAELKLAAFHCDVTPPLHGHPLIWLTPIERIDDFPGVGYSAAHTCVADGNRDVGLECGKPEPFRRARHDGRGNRHTQGDHCRRDARIDAGSLCHDSSSI